MLFKKKPTPREAFIGLCLGIDGADEFVDPREVEKMIEVFERYGFSDDEVEKIANKFMQFKNPKEAMNWGAKTMASIMDLDSTMRKNLVQALTEIAQADEKIDDLETTIVTSVKAMFGML